MTEETHQKEHSEKHLDKMTVKELRDMAAEIPHERAIHDMKKEELIAFIKEVRGIKDEAPEKKKKAKARSGMTRAELKAKIHELKILKIQLLEAGQAKKTVDLRHQISKLKKKSRRTAAQS